MKATTTVLILFYLYHYFHQAQSVSGIPREFMKKEVESLKSPPVCAAVCYLSGTSGPLCEQIGNNNPVFKCLDGYFAKCCENNVVSTVCKCQCCPDSKCDGDGTRICYDPAMNKP